MRLRSFGAVDGRGLKQHGGRNLNPPYNYRTADPRPARVVAGRVVGKMVARRMISIDRGHISKGECTSIATGMRSHFWLVFCRRVPAKHFSYRGGSSSFNGAPDFGHILPLRGFCSYRGLMSDNADESAGTTCSGDVGASWYLGNTREGFSLCH